MITVGSTVTRILVGIPMELTVSEIDENFIHCGDWKFDKRTGAEVDELLGWGNEGTGSYLQDFGALVKTLAPDSAPRTAQGGNP